MKRRAITLQQAKCNMLKLISRIEKEWPPKPELSMLKPRRYRPTQQEIQAAYDAFCAGPTEEYMAMRCALIAAEKVRSPVKLDFLQVLEIHGFKRLILTFTN